MHCGEDGSHRLDHSFAKQSLVALSSREAEFYGIVKAVATSRQTSQIMDQIGMQLEVTFASDSSAARGSCTRTVREGATPFNQRVVDTGSVLQKGIPVGFGGHALELGRHRNESAHVREVDVAAGASKAGVGMPHQIE